MNFFENYGELRIITEATGILILEDGRELEVVFQIARKDEHKLLFSAVCEKNDIALAFALADGIVKELKGVDAKGRSVIGIGPLVKDTFSDENTIINGYLNKAEIGSKSFDSSHLIKFSIVNFLFSENKKEETESKNGQKGAVRKLDLSLGNFECHFKKLSDYSLKKEILKRSGRNQLTSNLVVKIGGAGGFDKATQKVQKLLLLLSYARSTYVYWASCIVENELGKVAYEVHYGSVSRKYHGSSLISESPKETITFIEKAWSSYDQYHDTFDLNRFLYGYMDIFSNSFIETRSLNISVLIDSLASRWAIEEKKQFFIDESTFNEQLKQLRLAVKGTLKDIIIGLKPSYANTMASKVIGFKRRPLKWKLQAFNKSFKAPFSNNEISRYVHIRDSLANNSLFPEDEDNTEAFLFLRHFLDRMILSLFEYSGKYFDMESLSEKRFNRV